MPFYCLCWVRHYSCRDKIAMTTASASEFELQLLARRALDASRALW